MRLPILNLQGCTKERRDLRKRKALQTLNLKAERQTRGSGLHTSAIPVRVRAERRFKYTCESEGGEAFKRYTCESEGGEALQVYL